MPILTLPRACALAAVLALGGPGYAQATQDMIVLTPDHPGMLASWMQSRPVYSSGGQAIPAAPLDARPADWRNVARIASTASLANTASNCRPARPSLWRR